MPLDSDPIVISRRSPDDITSIIIDIASHIQYKFIMLMLLIFIILSSDMFINRMLAQFKGAVDYKSPTSYGVILQGMFLAMSMMLVDGLIRQKII